MAFTRTQARAAAYQVYRPLGRVLTADAVIGAATFLTHVAEYRDSEMGQDDLKDRFAYVPAATGSDTVKRVDYTDVGNGRLYITDPSGWGATGLTAYELTALHPNTINGCFNLAQREFPIRDLLPLTLFTDGDMRATGTTDYTAGGSATLAKNTTATNIWNGTQSLSITAGAASDYARSATVRCQPGKQISFGAMVRVDVGQVTLRGYDVTGAAYFTGGTDAVYLGEEFTMLWWTGTTPSGCEEMRISLNLSGASDVAYVDHLVGPYQAGRRLYPLASSLDQGWKLTAVRPGEFIDQLSGNSVAGLVYDANSLVLDDDLLAGTDYQLMQSAQQANANKLLLNNYHAAPVYLAVERSSYDVDGAITTESASVAGDLDEFLPYFMYHLFSAMADTEEGASDPSVAARLAEYTAIKAAYVVHKTKPAARIVRPSYSLNAGV